MPVYNYTTLDDAFQVGFTTGAMGINDAGQIVGGYTNAGGGHGFLYSGGTYTPIDDPLATKGTGAAGINSVGHRRAWLSPQRWHLHDSRLSGHGRHGHGPKRN
jgi:probable HAF family extracellular repeat protein